MRCLVTGGAGFIGSHLVDKIIAEGHTVVVLDNFASGTIENLAAARLSGRLDVIDGSVLDFDLLRQAMAGVDIVFHLAVECVRKSLGEPLSNHAVNATGTLHALQAARQCGVARFVYCSSSEVYGNSSDGALQEDTSVCAPTTVYGAAKLAGELYALAYWRAYGLPVVVVRPFNAFGPRAHQRGVLAEAIPRFMIRALSGRSPIIFGDGMQGRDFTYVTDTADGIWRVGTHEETLGSVHNIGWGRAVPIRTVAQSVIRESGRNDVSIEFRPARPGDIWCLIADVRKTFATVGFRPTVEFDDGMRRYMQWFRSQHSDPASLLEEQEMNWDMSAT
jgi:UDP-glucose 4-epimerase